MATTVMVTMVMATTVMATMALADEIKFKFTPKLEKMEKFFIRSTAATTTTTSTAFFIWPFYFKKVERMSPECIILGSNKFLGHLKSFPTRKRRKLDG